MPGLISLVVPTYNVAPYLGAFLDSLAGQRGGLEDVEVIVVDDGSTDGSGHLVTAWIEANPAVSARIITQPNRGLPGARNTGLAAATGVWVTFPDPDDVLTPGYLAAVRGFLTAEAAAQVPLVATNVVFLLDETGEPDDSHPLRSKFAGGHHRIVDLASRPDFIHLSAATALYRRDLLQQWELRFDERIRPTFEDAHLTAHYLLRAASPSIALLEDAVYLYRRRADGGSQVQTGWTTAEKYEAVPRHGWLDLLRSAAAAGPVPRWVQYLVLYDLFFYFRSELKADSESARLAPDRQQAFLATLAEVLEHIDTRAIVEFRATKVRSDIRRALLLGMKGAVRLPTDVYVDAVDHDRGLVRLRYFLRPGPLPAERFLADDAPVRPVDAQARPLRFYGRDFLTERTAWLPAGATLAVDLDGIPAVMQVGGPGMPRFAARPGAIRTRFAPPEPPQPPLPQPPAATGRNLRQRTRGLRPWSRRGLR